MKTFTRDSTIKLKFTFKNADGIIISPPGANVSLSYLPFSGEGFSTTVTYPLALDGTGPDWVYEWDSSVAEPCVIAVHAETTGGPPTSAIDTEFRLKANRANKQLAGDW